MVSVLLGITSLTLLFIGLAEEAKFSYYLVSSFIVSLIAIVIALLSS